MAIKNTHRPARRAVVGYIRVSTKRQAREGVSLKDQERRIRDWARRLGGGGAGGAVSIHADEGLSGRKAGNRPALQSALEAVCAARGVLVVYSLSRLARSVRDAIDIADRLEKAGADLVSLTDPIDTTTAMGRAFFAMMAVMARLESDLISERVRAAIEYRRAQMLHLGSRVPYGFDLAADGLHLKVNRREHEVIARMKRWRRAGASYWLIAQRLNTAGVKPKMRVRNQPRRKPKGHQVKGSAWQRLQREMAGKWLPTTVRRIVLRPATAFAPKKG